MVTREYYLEHLDFPQWCRYYYILRAIIESQVRIVLEIGAGNQIVKDCIRSIVEKYRVMDVNAKLKPDIISDVRELKPNLKEGFDCVIASNVLEHIPFPDFKTACSNLSAYLVPGGKALVTIPHRRSHFLFMTPTHKPHVITVPTGFLSPGSFYRRFIRRKIWIDPSHCWEIGDGKVRRTDVERAFQEAGLTLEKFRKLVYVDFWVLQKEY